MTLMAISLPRFQELDDFFTLMAQSSQQIFLVPIERAIGAIISPPVHRANRVGECPVDSERSLRELVVAFFKLTQPRF